MLLPLPLLMPPLMPRAPCSKMSDLPLVIWLAGREWPHGNSGAGAILCTQTHMHTHSPVYKESCSGSLQVYPTRPIAHSFAPPISQALTVSLSHLTDTIPSDNSAGDEVGLGFSCLTSPRSLPAASPAPRGSWSIPRHPGLPAALALEGCIPCRRSMAGHLMTGLPRGRAATNPAFPTHHFPPVRSLSLRLKTFLPSEVCIMMMQGGA